MPPDAGWRNDMHLPFGGLDAALARNLVRALQWQTLGKCASDVPGPDVQIVHCSQLHKKSSWQPSRRSSSLW
eukprot:814564-Pyramimonas_sp.AAC.1